MSGAVNDPHRFDGSSQDLLESAGRQIVELWARLLEIAPQVAVLPGMSRAAVKGVIVGAVDRIQDMASEVSL